MTVSNANFLLESILSDTGGKVNEGEIVVTAQYKVRKTVLGLRYIIVQIIRQSRLVLLAFGRGVAYNKN